MYEVQILKEIIEKDKLDPSVSGVNGSYILFDIDSEMNWIFHFFSY